MSSPPGGWSSPTVTGQPPPPCSTFTLTPVGDKRAAMFGGWDGSQCSSDLLVAELGRHSVVSVMRIVECVISVIVGFGGWLVHLVRLQLIHE